MVFIVDEVPKEEISISEDGENVLTLNYGESSIPPFIHPVYALNGMRITEGIRDTKQHHLPGVCFSLGTVKDHNRKPLTLKNGGTELNKEFIKKSESKSNEILKIISHTTWIDSDVVLMEAIEINVKPVKNDLRILDLNVVLQAKAKEIFFDDDIGLSYSAVEMEYRKTANANGQIGEVEVNHNESQWATLCGIVANTAVGVAICPHPENGLTQFLVEDAYQGLLFAKTTTFKLSAGEERSLRYRVLVYLGDLFTFDIDEYYSEFCME